MSSGARDTTSAPAVSTDVDAEPLIGIRELAIWLSVSQHTVRKWVSKGPEAGLLPRTLRVNGSVRFAPADVRRWLDDSALG
jgi:predicted DNA-binding transcriptional regulator AlpA